MRSASLFAVATLGAVASAYQLPANLKKIYDQHKVCCKHRRQHVPVAKTRHHTGRDMLQETFRNLQRRRGLLRRYPQRHLPQGEQRQLRQHGH